VNESQNTRNSLFTEDKRLPNGTFLRFGNLPADMTDEKFSEWLAEAQHLYIPVDHINIHRYPNGSSALISVPKSEIIRVFNWLLMNGEKLDGKQVVAQAFGPTRDEPFHV
jgi:hypothetical protein